MQVVPGMVSVTAKNEAEAMTRLKDRQFD